MIEKLEIAGVHMDVEPKLQKYVLKKLGSMDRYLPKRVREPAHMEVKLKESNLKSGQQYTCEVILFLPGETIRIAEQTMNIYAAVDITETKLKNSIKKYKDNHAPQRLPGKLKAKIRSKAE